MDRCTDVAPGGRSIQPCWEMPGVAAQGEVELLGGVTVLGGEGVLPDGEHPERERVVGQQRVRADEPARDHAIGANGAGQESWG